MKRLVVIQDEVSVAWRKVSPQPLMRHADHDPALICRPAFGNGLCSPLAVSAVEPPGEADGQGEQQAAGQAREHQPILEAPGRATVKRKERAMGDTRPPPDARIPDIEVIRLRAAKMAAAGGSQWGAATTGEALADIMLLLAALDAALTADRGPGIRAAIADALDEAGGV